MLTRDNVLGALRSSDWIEAVFGTVFRRGDDTAFVYETNVLFAADVGDPIASGYLSFAEAMSVLRPN